jgi:hypothetical protein
MSVLRRQRQGNQEFDSHCVARPHSETVSKINNNNNNNGSDTYLSKEV